MKYGIREICEVVLKAKDTMHLGKKTFYKGEPVLYFDTLKTSGLEGSSTTVYATGGRGNARLMAWDGEKTVTFTMEDALISPEGLMILSGAGLIEATTSKVIPQHVTMKVGYKKITHANQGTTATIDVLEALQNAGEEKSKISADYPIYVMFCKDGEIISEPYIVDGATGISQTGAGTKLTKSELKIQSIEGYTPADLANLDASGAEATPTDFDSVIVDMYLERTAGLKEIDIAADSFGSNFYLEASTLFRKENGKDVAAEFIIPNCKIQSNFNFSMAASGDPSTFTFTMDAFPDYTIYNPEKKVICAIQIYDEAQGEGDEKRKATEHDSVQTKAEPDPYPAG